MRLIFLLVCCTFTGANLAAQCPIQLVHASWDAEGKKIAIRYRNVGTHVVQDVSFVLTGGGASQMIRNLGASGVLRPKQDRTVVFPSPNTGQGDAGMEVGIQHVSFADHSTWTSTANEKGCRIVLSQP